MEQNVRKGIVPGIILIGIGILFLLNNFRIEVGDWIVLGIGIIFIIAYFTKKQTGFLIAGLILSYIGTIIFLNNTLRISQEKFGALFLIALGLAFLTIYFMKKKAGFIIPGFILPAIGAYKFIISMDKFSNRDLWPLIFMTLAAAFLLIFLFEYKAYGAKPLVVSLILFGVGVLGFMTVRGYIDTNMWKLLLGWLRKLWPVLFIIAGLMLIFKNMSEKRKVE
ncbi:MAG: hypothetical protein GX066_00765 [Clostridiaceae bacterium]|nr:hypothetical protein [Clostridiaceae bacterium]